MKLNFFFVNYPEDLENKIGFNLIRGKIKLLCNEGPARELVDLMQFSSSYKYIHNSVNQTNEFTEICLNEDHFPSGFYGDINLILTKAGVQGSYIELMDILDLRLSLETIKSVLKFFKNKTSEDFPFLQELIVKVKFFPFVLDSINRIINKQGKLKDNASSELENVRKKITEKQSGVYKQLGIRLRKAQKEGWVDQDASLSVRDGRVVIPVPSTYKRRIQGIVHDESATGKTSYIEPAEIVEINNSIKELQYAEKREIIKILIEFTESVRPYIDELKKGGEFLAELDFIRAKALFSISLKAIMPEYSDSRKINWYGARHPILFLSYSKERKKVVPLDIKLGRNERILLISGPNAGGKSVCLKTVGLIQYMFQCGLPVPVDKNSRMGIFSNIFIDIGDEQSIENDLSTYSSHLINMKYFLKNAKENTLLLIDEFGTGTEPLLGGSLAESILSELNKCGTFGVITTHYSNLKHFASSAEGIVNGAMLFDNVKMQPLFELSIGKPGSSFAFEIAAKIGLPPGLLSEAADRVGEEHISFDKHLRDIERDKRYWERKRKNIRKAEKRIEDLIDQYNIQISSIKKQTRDILDEAREEAGSVLEGANKIIENTIKTIRESQAQKQKTREARKELNKTTSAILTNVGEKSKTTSRINKIVSQEKIIRGNLPSPRKSSDEERKDKSNTIISIGDKVILIGHEACGEVLEINKNTAIVMIGNMKTSLKRERLQKISNTEFKRMNKSYSTEKDRPYYDISKKQMEFSSNIDVRGLRADEALQKIADFIDEAIMLNKSEVRILHGKGNGILRQIIREYLYGIDLIKKFRDEDVRLGGSGITVVLF